MPTGYTADVKDGKVTTFPEFALQCARAFGALIEMRDDPKDAPIPDEFTPSEYHVTALAKAEARLAELATYDLDRAEREAGAEYVARLKYEREREERRLAEKARYEAMLDKVLAWEPPTEQHVEMKKFMVDQLESSIGFDCSPIAWPEPVKSSPQEWLAAARASAEHDVEYHTKHLAEDRERAAGRTAWVAALRQSLSEPVAS